MTLEWRKRVPLPYIPITTCYYLEKQYNVPHPAVDVVICTSGGQLVEVTNNHIGGACEIKTSTADSITSFTKYDPHCRYYIVKSENTLIIVAKKKHLKIVRTFQNIKKFQVHDFWEAGSQQVGIWELTGNNTEVPDLVTDFREEASSYDNPGSDTFAKFRNEKLQEIKLKIAETECKLKEKKKCTNISCHVLLDKHHTGVPDLKLQLIHLVGNARADHAPDKHQLRPESLEIRDVWQRVHHGQWIIGVSIHNSSKRIISDLNLILQCRGGHSLAYSMHIMVYKMTSGDTADGEWHNVTVLHSDPAVVIGRCKQPTFFNIPAVTISGVITYTVQGVAESERQIQVPCFQLNAKEFAMESLTPFTQQVITEADFLSVKVASHFIILTISGVQDPLHEILMKQLGFEAISGQTELFHKRQLMPRLAGILLGIHSNMLHVYARDPHQVLLLVHCMYIALPLKATIALQTPPQTLTNVNQSYESLYSELELFRLRLYEWKDKIKVEEGKEIERKSNITVPREIFSEFRKQHAVLESQTDLCFVGTEQE